MSIHFFSLSLVMISGFILEVNAMVYQEQLDIKQLELLFGEDGCIDGGTLSVSEINPVLHPVVHEEEPLIQSEQSKTSNEEAKSPKMLINELAVFNKIPFEYFLTKEEGPAHSKQFTVSLKLGEEEYVDEGNSIKNAKHNVARWALKSTQYNHPPIKSVIIQPRKINKNPVQKLEEFVSKDTSIKYTFKTKNILESSANHENKYHENMYLDPTVHEVTVKIGHVSFTGEGLTSDSAKHQAAHNALNKLKIDDAFCSLKNLHGIIRDGGKCPISLVNEFAVKGKLKVNFDCIDEEGPAHNKIFTIKCKVGKFESVGKGTTKKSAKNEAALNMLKKLESYAYTNEVNCNNIFEKDKNKQKQKAKGIVKSKTFISSGRKTIPGDDINPISKLMELQQQSYNKHPPIFTLIEENGTQNRQFLIQVKVGDLLYVGSGPNKKLAKRRAAEGMLQMLRYSGSRAIKDSLFVEKKGEFSGKSKNYVKKPLTKSGLYLNLENFGTTPPIKAKPSMEIEDNQRKRSNIVDDKSDISNNKVKSSNFKSPMLQLEKMSQTMGFRFQFSNFPKSNSTGFVSLLSLTTEPPKVCFDTGATPDIAEDNVTRKALAYFLSHLDSMSEDVKKLTVEDVSKEWFQLHVVNDQEETITEL